MKTLAAILFTVSIALPTSAQTPQDTRDVQDAKATGQSIEDVIRTRVEYGEGGAILTHPLRRRNTSDKNLQGKVDDEDDSSLEGGAIEFGRIFRILPVDTAGKSEATRVDLGAEKHEAPVGVLGVNFNRENGTINAVYPPSGLNKWQIHKGDQIVSYGGHEWRGGAELSREAIGQPGSTFQLTIRHDGREISVECPRVDSRLLIRYDGDQVINPNHFSDAASQTKNW
jgi:hypothetical protein